VKRGDVYWADLPPPSGRRPVLVVSRDSAIHVRARVVVAPVTTTVRGIDSEVPMGRREGLPRRCVANCDDLLTIPKQIVAETPEGKLSRARLRTLDKALRFALGIRY